MKDVGFYAKVGPSLQNDFGIPGELFARPNEFVRQLVRTCREASLNAVETAYLLVEAKEVDRDVGAQFANYGLSLDFSMYMAVRALELARMGAARLETMEEIASRRLVYTLVDAARVVMPDWRKLEPQYEELLQGYQQAREQRQRAWSQYEQLRWTWLGQYELEHAERAKKSSGSRARAEHNTDAWQSG